MHRFTEHESEYCIKSGYVFFFCSFLSLHKSENTVNKQTLFHHVFRSKCRVNYI